MDQKTNNSKMSIENHLESNSQEVQSNVENYDLFDTIQEKSPRKTKHGVVLNHITSTNTIKLLEPTQENETKSIQEVSQEQLMLKNRSVYSQSPTVIPDIQISSNLPSLLTIDTSVPIQPRSLFLLALSKLNESSPSLVVPKSNMFEFKSFTQNAGSNSHVQPDSQLIPPESLPSSPPSYSSVLQQMVVRGRPTWRGTFIPSPSFVPRTPPPNYTSAFDICIDSPIQSPITRDHHFGSLPICTVCPDCGHFDFTFTRTKIRLKALIMCLICCWILAPYAYLLVTLL